MGLHRNFSVDGKPIRSFEDEGISWFCINDMIAIISPEEAAPSPYTVLVFVSKERITGDPEIGALQEWLNVKLSN